MRDCFLVSDFGFSNCVNDSETMTSDSKIYMSPEKLSNQTVTNAVDIHSLGIILLEFICPTRSNPELSTCIEHVRLSGGIQLLVNHSLREIVSLCTAMVNRHADRRPNCQKINNHLLKIMKGIADPRTAPS